MNELSDCCKAPVVLCEGRLWDVKPESIKSGSTYSYGCPECHELCGLYVTEQDIRDSMPAVESLKPIMHNLDEATQRTIGYLYKIDGDVTPEQYQAIDRLRQLINEEFVGKDRQVSSQLIYDVLKEVLQQELPNLQEREGYLI